MNTLFSGLVNDVEGKARELADAIGTLPLPERVEALNRVREVLHEVSPFQDEPVDLVLWVPADDVEGNDYNPNAVAPPEMRLLKLSVACDGFTQPIVVWRNEKCEVVDGEHRTVVGKGLKRLHGYLPVTVIQPGRSGRDNRLAATIRHNRARGVHGVVPMTDVVTELVQRGWTDDEIARELGMDADEVLRFKQNKGLPELFKDRQYSRAWE